MKPECRLVQRRWRHEAFGSRNVAFGNDSLGFVCRLAGRCKGWLHTRVLCAVGATKYYTASGLCRMACQSNICHLQAPVARDEGGEKTGVIADGMEDD